MDIVKENTKLDNFRVRIGELQHVFDKYHECRLHESYFYHNIFTPSWIYESENEYVKIILSELDPLTYSDYGIRVENIDKYDNFLDLVSCVYGKNVYMKSINKLPRKDVQSYSYCSYSKNNSGAKYHTYKLIFWWLVVLALDNNLYNKYLDYVVDAADVFGFTEDMIDDWCEAVIYWLNGNDINKDCNLELKTKDGEIFFLDNYI
ncbi:hypothetical protein [Veillonella sp. 27098_8_77]|uniref:hypothetical protein n=1 Tax=Veillonella sp. 27098_8_77 TaxID=3003642 RepID=UPI00352EACE6